jgi:putative transcriptional regulator
MKSGQVRNIRRRLGLTQERFAKRIGVVKSTVARWETDQSEPSPLAEVRLKELRRRQVSQKKKKRRKK